MRLYQQAPWSRLAVVEPSDSYEVGDVVAYVGEREATFVHRVIEVSTTYLVTKGDNNQRPDSPVSYDRVLGKAMFVIPHLEIVLAAMKVRFEIPLLIFAIIALWGMNRNRGKDLKEVSYSLCLLML